MWHHGISYKLDSVLIFRLLGVLFITVSLAYNGDSCPKIEEISMGSPVIKQINVLSGAAVNISCCIKNNGNNSRIYIKESRHNTEVPALKKINDNEAGVTMKLKYKRKHYSFVCKIDEKSFSTTNVHVGLEKNYVQYLKCVAIDLLRINCIVKENHDSIYTHYSFFSNGTEIPAKKNLSNYTYEFNVTQYSTDRQFYYIYINSSNSLVTFIEKKTIDQYSIAKPRLVDVKLTTITTDSAKLTWKVPNSAAFEKYTKGLSYNISLKEEKSGLVINRTHIIKNESDNFWVQFSNLYPFFNYTVHLRIKAKSITLDDEQLTEEFKGTFITLSRPPNISPEIGIGNFYIHTEGKRRISLFWKPIPENEHNGPNFTYILKEIKENGKIIKPSVHIEENSALVDIDWKNTSQYEFKLHSRNEEGLSLQSSVLNISSHNKNIHDQMQTLTILYYNQNYTVSWLKPVYFNALTSFTLFWCIRNQIPSQTENQCKGQMYFKTFNSTTFEYTMKDISNKATLKFALSEHYNNDKYSSGMVWAKCYQKFQTYPVQVELEDLMSMSTENSITILWNTQCWHKAIIKKYTVEYCEDNTKNCKNKDIDYYVKKYEIKELIPSTKYNITITPILKSPAINRHQSKSFSALTKKGKNSAGLIIITSSAIIFVGALVLLVYKSNNKYEEKKDIRVDLPKKSKDESNVHNPEYKETFLSDIVTLQPLQFSAFNPPSTYDLPNNNRIEDQAVQQFKAHYKEF